ncbi:MAG: two-component system sensor protein [Erythrobacter sp. SCN 62-14]|nr:MAG: two-component system sensor protein [Erythrobacter sp. SCN 62-14]
MMLWAALGAVTLYLAGLFWLAAWRDRAAPAWLSARAGWVYGLSLAVYCTSWTFFGAVGTAATAGLDYLAIYLGPILLFTFGFGLIRKILARSQAQHSTSIADFLSARYGKSAAVAAMVTLLAALGTLPYMALQLQSVGGSLLTLNPALGRDLAIDELVLLVAAAMAWFAISFGSRRADRAGDNTGLVLTIAVEAVVKIIALLAIAGLALTLLFAAPGPAQWPPVLLDPEPFDARFVTLTLIAACAVLCLPRQFHMTFIEAPGERASPAMQWVFPAYLALTAAVIVPVVVAGHALLPAGTNPDMMVLALPLESGHPALALLAFIGGFSASAGMIVVASVALSIMITNDLIAPLLLRRVLEQEGDRTRIAARLLVVRRLVTAALLAAAYLFYRGFGGIMDLAGLGTLAFAAAAQFAPGLVLGMVSTHGNKAGMLAGLGGGFAAWLVLLIMPAASNSAPLVAIHPDPLVSGVAISLTLNIALYWGVSAVVRPSLMDAAQAAAFVGARVPGSAPRLATAKRVGDVEVLLTQFVGRERAASALASLAPIRRSDPASEAALDLAERTISGVIGTPSARMLIASWAAGDPIALPEVVAMFDETSRRLSFSNELLQTAIESIDQGVALVDQDMRLVAWNRRYQAIFDLPDSLVQVGTPIADLIRFNLARGGLDEAEIALQVARRLDHMRAGREHRIERTQADGRVLRIVGSPTPGGGYTTSYTDITADRRAEQALEDKVAERTRQLSEANAALAEATRSKTRFLAAASHDLIQPLNAARLFASALGEEVGSNPALARLVADLDGSIVSADRLIRALLDISKLDSGGVEPRLEPVALNQVLGEVTREFAVQAKARGLTLRCVPTGAWVMTDRALITSILRNLASNAVRYTARGGVVLGVRQQGGRVHLCVYDTGRGIAQADRTRIFSEFERGASTDREGLGLGLAIVRRSARLLGLEVAVASVVGRGSRFSLALEPIERAPDAASLAPLSPAPRPLAEAEVLAVDNDPSALAALAALLGRWGLKVTPAQSGAEALAWMPAPPDLVIMDYRLDGAERGDAAYQALADQWRARVPVILLTAEAGEETAAAAARMGATRLLKPSPPAALRALIAKGLADGREPARYAPGEDAATG